MSPIHCLLIALFLLLAAPAGAQSTLPGDAARSGAFYVSPAGNDAWSGRLAAPNAAKTDGPFATLNRARDAARPAGGPKYVFVRAGSYYLPEPLRLGPEDSGLRLHAYPGERPLLSGGRPLTGFRKGVDGVWTATVADAAGGKWPFTQLFVGEKRQAAARYPNADPKNPYTGGWSFVVYDGPRTGVFGATVGRIHNAGDWLEWKVQVPADGAYDLWLNYAASNKSFGNDNMAGRTTIQVDGGPPVPLDNLPDTGSFATYAWKKTASLRLTRGEHTLRWTNVRGGGLNLDALLLTDAADWSPRDRSVEPPAGKHAILFHAETYSRAQAKELQASEAPFPAYRDRFQFKPGDLKEYPLSPDAEIHIFPAWGWVNSILQVKRIDATARTVEVEANRSASQEIRVGNRYYVSNVREELDTPGEWFLDRRTGTLSLLPETADFEKQGVVAPVLDRIVEIAGDPAADRWVENVEIKGFTLSHTAYSPEIDVYAPMDAAVWLSGARRCTIEDNRFVNIGGYAARLENKATSNEFVGNEVAYAGQGGVVLNGPVATQPVDNVIAGNWIHHTGQVYKHVAGVYCVTASGTKVRHNRFEYLPRYAVSLKGFNAENYSHRNIVEYNDIRFTNLETNDTGAIETLGREKMDTGNVIQYNRILDVVGLKTTPEGKILSPHFTWGIYLDDYSSGTTVRGNLVVRHDWGGGCIHGGRNNVFENNIFVEGLSHQMRYQVRDAFCTGNRFVRNILVYSKPEANLFMHTGAWRPDVLAESDRNLFWHAQGAAYFEGRPLTPLGTLEQWRAGGFDRQSLVADPRFVDPAQDDYRLRPDSPALKLGFEPLPWDRIGLAGYTRSKGTAMDAARP